MRLDPHQTTLFQILSLDENNSATRTLNQLPTHQWQALLKLADGLHIAPLLYTRLKQKRLAVPPNIQQELRKRYFSNTGRNLAVYHAFRQLSTQLQAANIPMIPLKGVYLAEAIYPTLGERVIGDLDLLVPKDRIEEAIEIGIAANYHPIMPMALDAWLKNKHHVCPQTNADTKLTVEWHWHIIRPRPQGTIPIVHLWRRAVPGVISEQSVSILTPEDTIFHLAYHISYHHEFLFGIRNLCDLSLVCQTYAARIDWDAVGQRAKRWQFKRGVYLALMLARTHLAAPIPETFLHTFKPRNFSDEHLEMAAQQIFVAPSRTQRASKTRVTVQGSNGIVNKARALHQAFFLSPEQMAIRYGIRPGSQSTLARYWFRWHSLAQQAFSKLRRMSWKGTIYSRKGVETVSSTIKRKSRLSAWINIIE